MPSVITRNNQSSQVQGSKHEYEMYFSQRTVSYLIVAPRGLASEVSSNSSDGW